MNESGLNIEELLVWDRNQFQVCRMIGRRETRKPHPLAHTHTQTERDKLGTNMRQEEGENNRIGGENEEEKTV